MCVLWGGGRIRDEEGGIATTPLLTRCVTPTSSHSVLGNSLSTGRAAWWRGTTTTPLSTRYVTTS